LTPSTTLASAGSEPLLGAERMTLRAPALRWRPASARVRNFPVASMTTFDAEVRPRQIAGIPLAEHADLAAVVGDDLPVTRHLGGKPPEDRVVREQVGEGGGIGDVVDCDDLEVGTALIGGAHEAATDAAEAVDGDTRWHGGSPVVENGIRRYGRRGRLPSAVIACSARGKLRMPGERRRATVGT
jgi:hypothetical protein